MLAENFHQKMASIFQILMMSLTIFTLCGTCKGQVQSCKRIKQLSPDALSGIYHIKTASGRTISAYCEMGLNGGGYTFLHPYALTQINDDDVEKMFTDRTSFLLRVLRTDGLQPYAVLSQLQEYAHTPLKIGINSFAGYSGAPVNSGYIGAPYIFYGFLPHAISSTVSLQGLRINGVRGAYNRCDSVSASHFALFPNFKERTPYHEFHDGTIYRAIFGNTLLNPSRRGMPIEFFMFGEIHFGACGTYVQTNHMSYYNVVNMAIGFR